MSETLLLWLEVAGPGTGHQTQVWFLLLTEDGTAGITELLSDCPRTSPAPPLSIGRVSWGAGWPYTCHKAKDDSKSPPRTPRARARSQVLHLKLFSILLPPLTPTTLSAAWHQQLPRTGEGKGVDCPRNSLPSGPREQKLIVLWGLPGQPTPLQLSWQPFCPLYYSLGLTWSLISTELSLVPSAHASHKFYGWEILWTWPSYPPIFFSLLGQFHFVRSLPWPDKIKICLTVWQEKI